MKKNRLLALISVLVLCMLVFVVTVSAATISIDGNLTDWDNTVDFFLDEGGVDDETSPNKSDITEFGVYAATDALYLLMAWDNTSFPNTVGANVILRGADGIYYLIYAVAQDAATVPLSSLQILRCPNVECKAPIVVCTGTGCVNAQLQSATNWTDPFIPHTDCVSGTSDCTIYDTAAEMKIPWNFIGGPLDTGETIFTRFGSTPSGPSASPKDLSSSTNGIFCIYDGTIIDCYPSTPTAIEGLSFSASSKALPTGLALSGLGLVVIGGVLISVYLRRRALAK